MPSRSARFISIQNPEHPVNTQEQKKYDLFFTLFGFIPMFSRSAACGPANTKAPAKPPMCRALCRGE